MNLVSRLTALCTGLLLSSVLLASAAQVVQSPAAVIWLEAAPNPAPVKGEASFAHAPPNFRSFASAHVGEATPAQALTLRFGGTTTLTRIESSKDFLIEEGSTCAEAKIYTSGTSCVLMVRFTPQGPGARLGKLTITHTASAQPFNVGLGGNGYAPVVSFTPAVITTVAGTYPSSKGLLSGAQNLTVDGSDTLYVADTGNGLIRSMDSSGTFVTLASGYTSPLGIAVDTFGEVYFDTSSTMYEIWDYGPVVTISGTGSDACTASAPCYMESEALSSPGTLSMDPYNNLFFADDHRGAAISAVLPAPATLIYLSDPFPYQVTPTTPIVADASDNVYSLWVNGECEIVRQSLYDLEEDVGTYTKIAGGRTCGFSGDGGQAGNAEIGKTMGQMAFDLAGNLYFSDTANQRVRRIDAVTGIINTIAGTGTAGYTGDRGAGTTADLHSPTGVGVDSQGQVYIISSSAATGGAQVIRKLGPNGILLYGSQVKAVASAAKVITVANTGNSTLTLTNAVFTGTDPGDFSVDPKTTSCDLSAEATLDSGQSCKVGIIFKPTTTGARSANFELLDNTVTNSNIVQLAGTGTAAAATKTTLTSAANPANLCREVSLSVAVTSASDGVPTGSVQLKKGATVLGTATLQKGGATISSTALSPGANVLTAAYEGDSAHAPSTSAALNQQIVAQGCTAAR
jgi:hypothetical protein